MDVRLAGRRGLLALESLVDADVTPAGGCEGLFVPPCPAVAQPKAGDAGHEVELRRVGQSHPDRAEDDAARADVDVVFIEDLRDGVVAADVQDNVVNADVFGVDELVAGTRWSGRHAALQDEHAVVIQVAGGVLEAPDLVVLG